MNPNDRSLDDLKRCPHCRSADIMPWNLSGLKWKCIQCDDWFAQPFIYSEFYRREAASSQSGERQRPREKD